MRPRSIPPFLAGAATGLLIAAPGAGAPMRDEAEARAKSREEDRLDLSLLGLLSHQFETEIDDDNGEFDVTRVDLGLVTTLDLSRQLSLDLSLGFGRDAYSFSGDEGLAGLDPWEDINTVRVGARLNYAIDEQWTIWGGPIVSVSAETGADVMDGLAAGGAAGVVYRAGDSFLFGAGVGVTSRIEDSASIFPILILNWEIAEAWTLRTANVPGMSAGLELAYAFAPGWEAAIGARYETRRFRLDDDDAAPDGVGEETFLPVYARLVYRPDARASISVWVGLATGGELRLEDEDGHSIADEDFDPAPAVGVYFSVRF